MTNVDVGEGAALDCSLVGILDEAGIEQQQASSHRRAVRH